MAPKRGRPAAAASKVTKPAPASKIAKPAPTKAPATRRAGGRGAAAAAAALEAAEAEAEAAPDDNDDNNNDNDDNNDDADATVSSTRSRTRPILADRTNKPVAEPEQEKEKPKARGRPGRKAAATTTTTATTAEAEDSVMDDAPAASAAAAPKKRGRGRPKAAADDDSGRPAKRGRAEEAADVSMDVVEEEQEQEESRQDAAADATDMTDAADATATADDTAIEAAAAEPDNTTHSILASPQHQRARARARGSLAAASSASDDAAVRRRLGELTKKHDALEARYRDLREIGVKEAERNFDRLKKQGDERTAAANELVASLKAELATYRELAKEGARAKREWDASEARVVELQAQVGDLAAALGNAKAEAKTLATKLAAARSGGVGAESAHGPGIPGSAIKLSSTSAAAAAASAMHANTQTAQLKEDLYGDLTGLLVRSAKRTGSRELYDCIQTGRNGSLHFKLCIDDEACSDGEDAQFVYTPQLDASRDKALMELLPDYLVEEISFPRVQAAKFYKRVMQSLTEE